MSVNKWSIRSQEDYQGVASMLRKIADQVENDKKINIDGRIVELPESIGTKIKFKLKDDRSKFSIKLLWQENIPTDFPNTDVELKQSETVIVPKKLKEMKKLMDDSLSNLEASLKKGSVIDNRSANLFKLTVDDFSAKQNPKWQRAISELEDQTNQLLENLKKNEISNALTNIRNIWDQEEKYHNIYK